MPFVVDDQNSPLGHFISTRNRARQFDFLHTSFVVYTASGGIDIDHEFLCTLNAYATRYISLQPGQYRRHYNVTVGTHTPSDWSMIYEEMAQFLDYMHRNWASLSAVELAAYALWGLNHVHPFCEGNGRTARALSYYVLCLKVGQWLPGQTTVLEMIRTSHRAHHCEILQRMHDNRFRPEMATDLTEMASLLDKLIIEQLGSAPV